MNQLKSFTTLFVLCILCLCVWLHTFSLCKTYFFVIVQLGVFQMNMGKLNEVMCFFLKKTCCYIWSLRVKCVLLHSLSGTNG